MKIKKFRELEQNELDMLIDVHYNHWVQHVPQMKKEDTIYKFKELYVQDNLPFGIALYNDSEEIVGFCVFKKENLIKYPNIYPWLSDVMILEKYRGLGYGRILINEGIKILNDLGYERVYVWTDKAPDFYKKMGFKYLQRVEKNYEGYGELFYIDKD